MINTFDEYAILSELIGMEDRILAKKIDQLIVLMNDSPTATEFYQKLPRWIDSQGITFGKMKSEHLYKCGMKGPDSVTLGNKTITAQDIDRMMKL